MAVDGDGAEQDKRPPALRRIARRCLPATRASVMNERGRVDRVRRDHEQLQSQTAYNELALVDLMEWRKAVEQQVAEAAANSEATLLALIHAEVRHIKAEVAQHREENQVRIAEFQELLNDFADSLGRISDAARRFSDELGGF